MHNTTKVQSVSTAGKREPWRPDLEWEVRLDPHTAPRSVQGGEQEGCMRARGRFTGKPWRELRRQGGAGNV